MSQARTTPPRTGRDQPQLQEIASTESVEKSFPAGKIRHSIQHHISER